MAATAQGTSHNLLALVRETAEAEFRQFISLHNPEARAVKCHVRSGDPRHELLECAAELGADWLVVGSHNRTAIGRWLLGSVAEHVLRHARIPVLLVPPHGQSASGRPT
jgi:nucleotide-binding universal stress UspA family protein